MTTVAEIIHRLAAEFGGTWEYNTRWQRWYRAEDGATAGWEISKPYGEHRPDIYEVSYTLDGLGLEVADVDGLDALIRAMRALEAGAAAVRAAMGASDE